MRAITIPDQTAVAERDRTATLDDAGVFARDGFIAPFRLFTRAESRRVAAYLRRDDLPAPADWPKGRAVHERFLYELAVHPLLRE